MLKNQIKYPIYKFLKSKFNGYFKLNSDAKLVVQSRSQQHIKIYSNTYSNYKNERKYKQLTGVSLSYTFTSGRWKQQI